MTQTFLFDPIPRRPAQAPQFDGATFSPELDGKRLATALDRVYALMRDGKWRTLEVIALECGTSEAGASARLRDLRKSRHGSHKVERRRVPGGNGLHEYRIVL